MQASGMSRSERPEPDESNHEHAAGLVSGPIGRSLADAWWDGEEWTGDFAPAQQVTPDGNRIRRARTR